MPVGHPLLAELSPREHEVLIHLVSGSRVASISERLGVTPNTVRNHLKSIYRKLKVGSQHQLIDLVHGLRDSVPIRD